MIGSSAVVKDGSGGNATLGTTEYGIPLIDLLNKGSPLSGCCCSCGAWGGDDLQTD